MLPKSRRLTRRNFPKENKGGFVVHSEHLSLRITPQNLKTSRFSAVISKKTTPGSPERHTWKRRIYEIIGTFEENHTLLPAFFVFFAKKGSAGLSFKDLKVEADGLLQQVVKK